MNTPTSPGTAVPPSIAALNHALGDARAWRLTAFALAGILAVSVALHVVHAADVHRAHEALEAMTSRDSACVCWRPSDSAPRVALPEKRRRFATVLP